MRHRHAGGKTGSQLRASRFLLPPCVISTLGGQPGASQTLRRVCFRGSIPLHLQPSSKASRPNRSSARRGQDSVPTGQPIPAAPMRHQHPGGPAGGSILEPGAPADLATSLHWGAMPPTPPGLLQEGNPAPYDRPPRGRLSPLCHRHAGGKIGTARVSHLSQTTPADLAKGLLQGMLTP